MSALSGLRITRGKYINTGETFERYDNWKTRKTAHLEMRSMWTGTIEFVRKSDIERGLDAQTGDQAERGSGDSALDFPICVPVIST